MSRVNEPTPHSSSPEPGAPTSAGDGGVEIGPGVYVASTNLRFQFARSGGPGGQNVNKLNTKAQVWVSIASITGMNARALKRLRALAGRRLTASDEIHLSAEESRSQSQNREEVMRRLRELIVEALVEPKVRRKTRPSRAARRKRLENKRLQGEKKSARKRIVPEK